MRSKLVAIVFIVLITIIFLNIETYTKKSINYEVTENKISLYNKIHNFIIRNNEIRNKLKNIYILSDENLKTTDDKQKILIINKWVFLNISKLESKEKIIDSHPTLIFKRSKGASDQFNDLSSIFLVYSNVDSFFKNIKFANTYYPYTFAKVNNYWTIIDPYNGLYFTTDNRLSSIKNIQEKKFKINAINKNNDSFIFYNKLINEKEMEKIINLMFKNFDIKKEIHDKHKYLRGGRSYLQDPYNRLIYEFMKFFRLI